VGFYGFLYVGWIRFTTPLWIYACISSERNGRASLLEISTGIIGGWDLEAETTTIPHDTNYSRSSTSLSHWVGRFCQSIHSGGTIWLSIFEELLCPSSRLRCSFVLYYIVRTQHDAIGLFFFVKQAKRRILLNLLFLSLRVCAMSNACTPLLFLLPRHRRHILRQMMMFIGLWARMEVLNVEGLFLYGT